MNRYLQEYFRRTNHSQRLFNDSQGDWLLVREYGHTVSRGADLFWAKRQASHFGEFNKICELLGQDGLLAQNGSQTSSLLDKNGFIQIAFLSQNKLYHSCLRLKASNSLEIVSIEQIMDVSDGELLSGNLCLYGNELLLSWAIQKNDGSSSVGISVTSDEIWSSKELFYGQGAFAPVVLIEKSKILNMVWAQADEQVFYSRFDMQRLNSEKISQPKLLANNGRQPVITKCDNGILIAYENHLSYPCSILISDEQIYRCERLTSSDCRFDYAICHSLNLVCDCYGVPNLFFVENHRKMLFCTRWLGMVWGPIRCVGSIYNDTPRSDSLFEPISRVEVSKDNGNYDDLGFIIEPAYGNDVVFSRETVLKINIDKHPIRFFDLKELKRLEGFELELVGGTKCTHNPLISRGSSGSFNSGRAVNSGTFIKTGDKWQSWFAGMPNVPERFEWWKDLHVANAVSTDGIHWSITKIKNPQNYFENTILNLPCQPTVYYDVNEKNEKCRYKAVYFMIAGEKELAAQNKQWNYLSDSIPGSLYVSSDGICWTEESVALTCQGGMWFEHCPMCLIYDIDDPDPKRRWKSYGYTSLNLGRRACSLATSGDLKKWELAEKPVLTSELRGAPVVPSGPWSQVHGMEVFKLDQWYVGLVENQYSAGSYDIELAVSRDGFNFDCVLPGKPIIPRGGLADWDADCLRPVGANVLAQQEEIRLYYCGSCKDKTSVGFISFDKVYLTKLKICPNFEKAVLETVPLKIGIGKEYELHLTGDGIIVSAQINDAQTNLPLSGFDMSNCNAQSIKCGKIIANWNGRVRFKSQVDYITIRILAQSFADDGNNYINSIQVIKV